MTAQRLLILGSGTFAVETLDIAEECGGFKPVGFVNSLERPAPDAQHAGLPVFWVDDIPYSPDECVLVAGIVSTMRRGFIEQMRQRGYRFASVVHPKSVISRRASLGVGCVIHAGTVISSNTRIADHVIINRGALIGHDNDLGAFCTVGPGANLAGALHVGEVAYIGVGAVIRDHLSIGTGAVVGAGAVVVKPVPARAMVAGVPASVIKTDIEGL